MKFTKYSIKSAGIITATALLPLLSSCNHKDLDIEPRMRGKLNVVFDWRNAPDANPSSMALYLYDFNGGEPLRFIFQNNYGGTIRVPFSSYDAICLNADLTDWAVISRSKNIDEYEVLTPDAEILEASGFATHKIPRAESAENERFASTPGMLWGYRLNNVVPPNDENDKTVIMYPDEKVCHYTIDVYDSGDVSRFSSGGIDATLSGMSEGYLIGKDCCHQSKVTHPFLMKPVISDNCLHAEILTFGESASHPTHILSIYLVRNDGKKWNCNIDVTDQVRDAKDPHHVHIIVRGIDLPEPSTGGGMSVVPDVDDWESVNITLKM